MKWEGWPSVKAWGTSVVTYGLYAAGDPPLETVVDIMPSPSLTRAAWPALPPNWISTSLRMCPDLLTLHRSLDQHVGCLGEVGFPCLPSSSRG